MKNTIKQAPIGVDIGVSVKAQAKVRLLLGLPVMALMAVMVWFWGSPYGTTGHIIIAGIAILYIAYVFSVKAISERPHILSPEKLAIVTSAFDPIFLSSWLSLMGEAASLFMAFYLFTVIGNGFRIGTEIMHICQVSSILGLTGVILVAPVWKQHITIGISFIVILIVVPLYATKLLRKLHEARALAERESKAKTQLLAKVSHELRTPLSGIVAAAQLISIESLEGRTSAKADTIMNLSKDLLREIDDLLDSAKYEASALRIESAVFELQDVMDRVRLTLINTAASKGIHFSVTVDPEIRDRVQGDSHYLARALLNLGSNAVKFTDQGRVDVSATLLQKAHDAYRIRFEVKDTGIGIPHEFHHKIFERFTQVSEGTSRKYGGTGLGMSISKEIVNLMGGEISVVSEPGKGSQFSFELNFPRAVTRQKNVTSENDVPIIYGKRVLIADDNVTNLTLLKELLERDQHKVRTARSGLEALELLRENDFDVVFLDYNMQDMDGAAVLQTYKFGKLNAAPTYFLTADVTATTAATLENCGPAGLLHKPITSDGLRWAIANVSKPETGTESNNKNPSRPLQPALRPVPTNYIDYSLIEELKAISDRPEFIVAVLLDGVNDIERNCALLLEAISASELLVVHDSAHALQGVCASIGAMRLASLTSKLHSINRTELVQHSDRWQIDIADARDQSISALRNIAKSYQGDP